jgi:hypothetical protein
VTVLLYRVFPYNAAARSDEPGHPLFHPAGRRFGRWDNPDLYRAFYGAGTAPAAVGETFAAEPTWSSSMVIVPKVEGTQRSLGVYSLDEERHPLLDLDDPKALVARAIRPTEVVVRNRPRTQDIARSAFREMKWSGLSWWSMHRPQWTLHVLWMLGELTVEAVEPLSGHAAVRDAARLLAKELDPEFA